MQNAISASATVITIMYTASIYFGLLCLQAPVMVCFSHHCLMGSVVGIPYTMHFRISQSDFLPGLQLLHPGHSLVSSMLAMLIFGAIYSTAIDTMQTMHVIIRMPNVTSANMVALCSW